MADKPLQAGDLDRRIDILIQGSQLNSKGGIDSTSYGPFLTGVYAKKEDKDGDEEKESNRETAFADTVFTIRFREDIKAGMRLVCEGVNYDILSIREGKERRQWTIIKAKRRD